MPPTDTARAGAAFTLEQLEVTDGEIVVSGVWSGVRGLRFVRPTLIVDGRQLLATLEHKPWAAEATPWTAAFLWEGGEIDPAQTWLSVAPSVTVRLVPGPDEGVIATGTHEQERLRFERRATEVDFLRDELRRVSGERDRALAQCDEAVRDREAAMRTRDRMEAERAKAVEYEQQARAKIAEVEQARLQALRERDEVLTAYRALEHEIHQVRAKAAAAAESRAAAAETKSPPPDAPPRDEPPAAEPPPADERPLGVRTIPAARVEGLTKPEQHHHMTRFDLFVFRAVGIVAAVVFVVLCLSLLRALA